MDPQAIVRLLTEPQRLIRTIDGGLVRNVKVILDNDIATVNASDSGLDVSGIIDNTQVRIRGLHPNKPEYAALLESFNAHVTGEHLTEKYAQSGYSVKPLFYDNYN